MTKEEMRLKITALEKQIDVLCARELVDIRNENVTLRLSLESYRAILRKAGHTHEPPDNVNELYADGYQAALNDIKSWAVKLLCAIDKEARAALGESEK